MSYSACYYEYLFIEPSDMARAGRQLTKVAEKIEPVGTAFSKGAALEYEQFEGETGNSFRTVCSDNYAEATTLQANVAGLAGAIAEWSKDLNDYKTALENIRITGAAGGLDVGGYNVWPPAEVEMTDDPPELVTKWHAFHDCWRIKDAAKLKLDAAEIDLQEALAQFAGAEITLTHLHDDVYRPDLSRTEPLAPKDDEDPKDEDKPDKPEQDPDETPPVDGTGTGNGTGTGTGTSTGTQSNPGVQPNPGTHQVAHLVNEEDTRPESPEVGDLYAGVDDKGGEGVNEKADAATWVREHKDKDGNVVEGHFKVSDEARDAIRAERAEATEAAKQAAESRTTAEQARSLSDAAEARLDAARESGDQATIDAATTEAATANDVANQTAEEAQRYDAQARDEAGEADSVVRNTQSMIDRLNGGEGTFVAAVDADFELITDVGGPDDGRPPVDFEQITDVGGPDDGRPVATPA